MKPAKKFSTKNTIREYITSDIPAPLKARYFGQLGVGLVMFVLGIAFMIAFRSVSAGLFACFMSLAFIALAIAFKISIVRGYTTIEGTVVDRTRLIPGLIPGKTNNVADGFTLVTADEKTIHIPAIKRKNSITVGTRLRVYLSSMSSSYVNQNGVTSYGNILGYEIIGIDN